jgi:DNA (cytosine-5)-methyltransferase 1
VATPTYSSSKASFFTNAEKELANTLVATDYKDPPLINGNDGIEYTVRRLTPTECARLQGFPDWWCSDLGIENPTMDDLRTWYDIFETHRKVIGSYSKAKTLKQISKWLKNPHSDSAEYKMWGNGVALPNVCFVLSGIVWYTQLEGNN